MNYAFASPTHVHVAPAEVWNHGIDGKSPDYYPLRWKIADGVEDLFVLHRGKAAAGALLLLAGLVVGFMLFTGDGDADDDQVATTSSSTTAAPATSTSTTSEAPSTTEATQHPRLHPRRPPRKATTTTTTTVVVSARAPASDAERDATSPGAIIEMGPTAVRLVGGFATDQEADETLTLASAVFPGIDVVDEQLVDDSYETVDGITFRLSAADLFGYNSDNINGTYLPVIDQLAAAMVAADAWQVQVTGHTDDTRSERWNQRLSEGRPKRPRTGSSPKACPVVASPCSASARISRSRRTRPTPDGSPTGASNSSSHPDQSRHA